MYRKDYMQRQFEELGKVMAKLLSFRKEKNFEAYEKEYTSNFKAFTSLLPAHVEEMSSDEFKSEFLDQNTLNSNQKSILADLLYEKLNLYLELGEEQEVKNLRDKCILLYNEINENALESEFNLGIHYRLNFLKSLASQDF